MDIIKKVEFNTIDTEPIEDNREIRKNSLLQNNDEIAMVKRIKLLNLIVEIVVKATLKEHYETGN